MAVTSTAGTNPVLEFSKFLDSGGVNKQPADEFPNNYSKYSKEEIQHIVNQAGPVLANELDRLYPSKSVIMFSDENLKYMARNGYFNDENGNRTNISDEARDAARKILDIGGGSTINPNGDPWLSEGDLRNAFAFGVPDKGNK